MKTAVSVTKNLTASGTAVANYVEANVRTAQRAAVQVGGTFVGTVTFEGTTDGATWFACGGSSLATPGTVVSTATAAGLFVFDVTTLLAFRARCSAFTSGTITPIVTSAFADYRAVGT